MNERIREKKHEIPMFSARTVRKMRTNSILIFIVVFACFELAGTEEGKVAAAVVGTICVVICMYLSRVMERCAWKLQEDRIIGTGMAGSRDISYEEIAEALQTRKIEVTTTSFRVPKRKGYISFHYEVGNTRLQKEIKESYRFLEGKVSAEFPKLTKTVISQMDRRFFYKKDRVTCSVVMMLASLVMLLYKNGPAVWAFIVVGLGQVVQYLMLGSLFKGVYFGKQAEEKIGKIFAAYPNVRLRKMRISYAGMAGVVLLTVLLNIIMLTVAS